MYTEARDELSFAFIRTLLVVHKNYTLILVLGVLLSLVLELLGLLHLRLEDLLDLLNGAARNALGLLSVLLANLQERLELARDVGATGNEVEELLDTGAACEAAALGLLRSLVDLVLDELGEVI